MNLNQLIQSKQYDKAIQECKALIADAELEDDNSSKLTGLVYLGIIFTQQELFYKSKEIFDNNFEEIISECNHFWNGKELTETYLHYNEIDKALLYNQAFLEQNPTNGRTIITIGHLLYLKADYLNALKTLEKANSFDNNNAQVYYLIASINLKLNNKKLAFENFEKAFDLGYEKSINEIIKLLFSRTGICDFENCTDCCCEGVILKGVDGKTINNEESLNLLVNNDKRNNCWFKNKTNAKGHWIFECNNLGMNNFCNNYQMRPNTCRDYPSSIMNTRTACSFNFKLNDNSFTFSSSNTLKVILHILKALKYDAEMNLLAKKNKLLLS